MKEATAQQAGKLTRDVAKAFFAADIDGDRKLSCEEFVQVVPNSMKHGRTKEELQALFDSVDYDGNGLVSMDEVRALQKDFPAQQH